jgi:hypothetical protein
MRNLWKLIDGKPVNISTMQTGTLRNGYTVSGYNALPADILTNEGWKPMIVMHPPDEIEGITYEVFYDDSGSEIIQGYRVVIPEGVANG